MSIRKETDTFVASPKELYSAPIVRAWSVTKCEDASCTAVHVFLFENSDKLIAHLPLDSESATMLLKDIHMAMTGQRSVN